MELMTIIPIIAAVTTITIAGITLYKKMNRSWLNLQDKISNLEKSLKVNQRVKTKTDITVPNGAKVTTIESGSEVELLSINTKNGIVIIRAHEGLLTTSTNIDNIYVDAETPS